MLKDVGDVFAADVMYHSNCLNNFRYDVDFLMAFEIEADKDRLEDTFKELIASMNINRHGYVLSDVRVLMNDKLKEKETGENMFSFLFCFAITISSKRQTNKMKKQRKCLKNCVFFFSLRFFSKTLRCFDIMKIIFFVQVLVLPYQSRS